MQLALMPSTIICSRSECCLRLLHATDECTQQRPPDAAIRAARLSPRLEAAQQLLKQSSLPSSRFLCLPLSGARLCRKAASRHACRRTPLLRVNLNDAAAVSAAPHACSDCACLPVVPYKPPMHAYRRTLTAEPTASTQQCLWCRCATLLIRHSIQLDCDAALTWIRAGPRPAAELAHNKTLQSKNRYLSVLHKSTRRVTCWYLSSSIKTIISGVRTRLDSGKTFEYCATAGR